MDAPSIEMLPPELIDQIAAGEVVERPSSVVKELVENSLDAGASHVTVEIEGGGKRRIRVVDDGVGMSESQAELALVRHATSKLRCIEDLFGIGTMGFRGEALASIAAVSRMTLVTRPRGEGVGGTRLDVTGGLVVDKSSVGTPVGTSIEVCDLMHNVPARQKFLKGDATETSHITDAVTKLALAHPDVHVKLTHGGRTTLSAPAHASRFERVQALLGSKVGAGLIEVNGDERGVRVSAYLAPPEAAQSTSRGVQLFVGRRAVRDRGLLHALSMGYGELVPRGRYPVAVVFVDAPDPEVDVNVHPQKLEVRFSDPQRVYAAVRHTVMRGVGEARWIQEQQARSPAPLTLRPWAPASAPVRASELAERYARDQARALIPFRRPRPSGKASPAFRAPSSEVRGPVSESRGPGAENLAPDRETRGPAEDRGPNARLRALQSAHHQPARDGRAAAADRAGSGGGFAAGEPAPEARARDEQARFFGELRYLGQLDRTYLVCERDGELVLIDQHAAHERVAFARLKARYSERAIPVQKLLFHDTIELDDDQAAAAADSQEELLRVGFEMEPFGGNTWAIKAVPTDLREHEVRPVVTRLLAELASSGGSRAVEERIDNVLATIACHSVVRAGDVLSDHEAEALLGTMDEVSISGYCPHGRPVLLRMRIDEIARRFGR